MSGFNVQGMTKRYGDNTVVDDLDLEIEEGEFVVLLGPSGCGKTTTLRCIAGLERPSEGTIAFRDRTVFDAERRVDVPPNKREHRHDLPVLCAVAAHDACVRTSATR